MRTSTKIIFGLYDLTAKNDSTLTAEDKQSFSNLEELKLDTVNEIKYATLEKNYFNLDGTKELMNFDNIGSGVGLWSKSMSDNQGSFSSPPTLIITFLSPHSSNGLTFHFSEDNYCSDLNIKYYNGDTLIKDLNFTPNQSTYFCNEIVQNYNKIIVTFNKTSIPYRYLKLINIVYGQNRVFQPEEIMSANILEEIDPLSNEISINTLEFSIFSRDESFNMLNPKGVYKLLQTRQIFRVYETNGDKEINMGTFYLDEWKNETESISNMKAIDLIGLLDKTTYYGGIFFNESVITIIDNILTSANMDEHTVTYEDEESMNTINQIRLSGYIPICKHREALQQVLFAAGLVADCSRNEKIKIYKLKDLNVKNITYNRKKQDSESVELNDIVTGVQVTSHQYLYNTNTQVYSEKKELYNADLTVGEHFIKFSEPVYGITISGATLVDIGCAYVKINVTTNGNVKIEGYEYYHVTKVYESKLTDLLDSDKENILQVTDATLVSDSNAKEVADRILNYYQKTYKMSVDFKIEDESISDTAIVETLYNQKLKGNIKKLDIDLTGGFLATASIVGSLYEEEQNENIDS